LIAAIDAELKGIFKTMLGILRNNGNKHGN
jgi:hypothetical protein